MQISPALRESFVELTNDEPETLILKSLFLERLRKTVTSKFGGIGLSLLALSFFSLIYASLWGFVGRFPAESMEVSRDDARSVHAMCYDKSDTSQIISIPFPRYRGSKALWLHVRKKPISDGQLGQLSRSRALFHSIFDDNIYIINQLDPIDVTQLQDLAFWGLLNKKDVDRVVAASPTFSPTCNAPATDQGVAEAYWATKGTSVLHHWAFLYDGSFSDGKPVHGQYGFLVSRLAKYIASIGGLPGPTGFVRVAWIAFWFVGICYSAAFLFVFRKNLAIAATGLSWQIASYASVGAFAVLCAPGYHWTRELVMVMPALLLALIADLKRPAKPRIAVVLAFCFIVTAYALDPTFAIVATVCFALAFAIKFWRQVRAVVEARPIVVLIVGFLALAVIAIGLLIDGSNVIYAATKTLDFAGPALANPTRNVQLDVNIFAALLAIFLCAVNRLSLIAAYYGLIGIVSFEFFVVTPDSFHWAKYLEFVVPIYVILGSALYSWLDSKKVFVRVRPFVGTALAITSIVLLIQSYQSITSISSDWQLRLYDSVDAPYFASVPVTINGRLLDANVNEVTVDRLRAFPSGMRRDFILSPLDKYIIFLFDEHNGFASSVDATAWLDDDGKLQKMESEFSARHATVLLDSQVYLVNPLAGLLSTNPVVGTDNSQSVLIEKARIRMNELAAYVLTHCSVRHVGLNGMWDDAHC